MKLLRTLGVAAATTLLATSAFAGNYDDSEMPTASMSSNGVSGMGVSLEYNGLLDKAFALGVNFVSGSIDAGISGSFVHFDTPRRESKNWDNFALGGHLGYRMPLVEKLFGSVGAQGVYLFHTDKNNFGPGIALDHNPYSLGMYVGLSYEPTEHISIYTRVGAVSYVNNGYNDHSSNAQMFGRPNEWRVFQDGVIGLGYYFG